MENNKDYHVSVLLNAAVDGLNISSGGTYVDVTYGAGGHSAEILKRMDGGKLYAFDQDEDAERNLIDDDRLVFVRQNFRYMKNYLKFDKMLPVDGVLADLGVSSYQFDTAERGFSIRYDGELDMRMDGNAGLTAVDVLNDYEEEEISKMLWNYADLRPSRAIATEIVKARKVKKIETGAELKQILNRFLPKGKENSYLARVYQALRIEVNQELEVLKEFLQQCEQVLKPGGRLVVISYHSLEDRLVKQFIKTGKFGEEVEKDFFGKEVKPFKAINKKPIIPEPEEILRNNRARSAKLRIAERLDA